MVYSNLLKNRTWRKYFHETPQINDPTLSERIFLCQDFIGNPLLFPDSSGYFSEDPLLYEFEERVRPDEILAFRKLDEIVQTETEPNSLALDICCGTGISTRILAKNPNFRRIIGVDTCGPYLTFNANLLSEDKRVHLTQMDAVEALEQTKDVDVAVLSWAYHHIEDDRKADFMRLIGKSLSRRGRVYVLENILPNYQDKTSRNKAVEKFYDAAISEAQDQYKGNINLRTMLWELRSRMQSFIQDSVGSIVEYEKAQVHEFKVHYETFRRHVREAGLKVEQEHRVWPRDNKLGNNAGNYAFVLTTAS